MNLDNLTPERKALANNLARLYTDGFSYDMIAKELGVTRNVVAGLVRRLGLTHRQGFGNKKPKTEKPAKPARMVKLPVFKPMPFEPKKPNMREPKPLFLSALEIKDGQCRYPVSDRPTLFCGAPASGSWCEYHRKVVFHRE